ncbi:MAG TPA: AraC family transcriptional regulator [Cyclobacteriaceae bacterium]|nr:AraC family transcriptional regulator [Cyclobacteriaceae bacterium]
MCVQRIVMILHQFPDLQWLKQQADQRFINRKGVGGSSLPNEGWPTVILNTQTKSTYRDNILGPLSLFLNLAGESSVSVAGKSVRIKEGLFFLSNADQHYTLEVDEKKPVETFNIHFGEYFADQIFEALKNKVENLLDNTFQTPHVPMAFHNRLQSQNDFLKKIVLAIKQHGENDALFREEKLIELLTHLLKQESEIVKMRGTIPAIKSSTREEILQRLFYSTDYIYSNYHKALSLEELAQASCLSKFHFLRLFKIAFRKTPHQFVTEVRLKKAQELLKHTKLTIHEVSRSIGFDNASSFSRLFYNSTGVYPTHYQSIIS